MGVMTHPSFPAKSLSDVIALAKKEPGKVTVGTPPPPTLNYFATVERLNGSTRTCAR